MYSGENNSLNRSTTFSQEIQAVSDLRLSRRNKMKKYPNVSVVLSTVRPNDLTSILSQIKLQTLKNFELAIGLHGIQLNAKHKSLINELSKRQVKVKVEKYAKGATLGSILTDLASKTSGDYVAKMDDDDYYGPEHLRDLVDAIVDKNADAVGRAMNYVYLEPLDLTVRRFGIQGTQAVEIWSDWVCGGTILVSRSAGESAGWFGSGTTAVDRYLLGHVTENGGKIWRTFGAGYIYKRSFTFHTYITNYSKYLKNASQQVVGLWQDKVFGTQ
jgi:glycosyltransferase involved in cell wall biosynthesis